MSRATRHSVRPLHHALTISKAVLVATTVFLAVLSVSSAGPASSDIPGSDAERPAAQELHPLTDALTRLEQLTARHDCSATGFGPDVIPGSSLVLRGQRIRYLSFDDGWDVYVGNRRGTLLAVCRPAL